mgnify:CR=1 FL=1
MPALGARVTTTTREKILPYLVDTVLNSNVFATRMLGKAKKWSGSDQQFPIKVSKNSTGTSFSGFDTLSTTATNNRVLLTYDPKFYQITVALPLDEISANNTEDKILDLVGTEVLTAAHDMADDIGTLFYSDGTGNSSKDFLGLGAIVDDGTTVATIGGQSRSTYTTLQSTVTASGGTLTLARMQTLYSAVSSGSQRPTLGLCPEAVFDLYEQLLNPQERIVKDVPMMKGGLVGGTGFTGLHFRGFPIIADEKATAQTLFFINEDFINWYALPLAMTEAVPFKNVDVRGNDYSSVKGLGFSFSGWIKPSNQAAIVGHIYLGGELTTDNPKRQGRLTGITGV